MKKIMFYVVAFMLPVWMLNSCKGDHQSGKGGETTDSVSVENTQIAKSDIQKTSEADDVSETDMNAENEEPSYEEMESQGGMYSQSDVKKNWKQRVIKVPGQKSDIAALFEAFYTEWPTLAGSRIVHETNPTQFPENDYYEEGSTIDLKNGYVESAWYEPEEIGTVSACVWKRKNGHKLFAVNFHIYNHPNRTDKNPTMDFLCFYDFDPAKRTLTPEESPIKREELCYPDKEPLWFELPQEGKTLTVVEDAPGDEVAMTYYSFDGQNLKFEKHNQ